MKFSIKSLVSSFIGAIAKSPEPIRGYLPVTPDTAPSGKTEIVPAFVTLKSGQVVPAPVEGVNVEIPKPMDFDYGEICAFSPPKPSKYNIPPLTPEQAAGWCP